MSKPTFSYSAVLVASIVACLPFGAVGSSWDYGARGLEWSDADTGSYLWLGLRAQPRYSNIQGDLRLPDDFDKPTESGGTINRARYKIGARYQRDFTFYHEYDLRNSQLLDLRATWVTTPAFNLRVGQWKSDYNRERIDSSGKQQFVERSISTYWFTLDRQWGAMASGHIGRGTAADSNWWTGVLGGNGRGNGDDGGRPMVMGRWQWNYTGNTLPFSQSALKRYDSPHASLSFSAMGNDSRYTRFSSNGGGQLPGYEEGEDNQYRLVQSMQEWAWQRGGLSLQQELHFKSIHDRVNGGKRNMVGGYAQIGWFPKERWSHLPDNLEVALRGAYVDPDAESGLKNVEYTFAVNWFLSGHRNKITFDIAYLSTEDEGARNSDYRYQLQWDLSL